MWHVNSNPETMIKPNLHQRHIALGKRHVYKATTMENNLIESVNMVPHI